MTPPVRILIYGQDMTLLETRCMILEHEGYAVEASTELQVITDLLFSQTFQVLILCHSVTEEEREYALNVSHSSASHTVNLILSRTGCYSSEHRSDAVLNVFPDPRTLIDSLKQLTCRRKKGDERQIQI